MSRRSSRAIYGYLFLSPYLILFTSFLIIPLIYGLGLSFVKYEMISPEPPRFVGFANYSEVFHDAYFWKALMVTTTFVVISVPITIVLALGIAAALEQIKSWRQNLYRLAIFLPMMITITVVAILWRWFFESEFGLFNSLLSHIHVKIPWLLTPHWAMSSIILMTLWWTIGGPVVILQAGLKQIPTAFYEAASLDGATGLRRFFYITLPLLRPVLLFVSVTGVIGAFQIFGQTFLVTAGGPELSTRVLMQYIYETAFNNYRLGYGSAMSWLLFVVIVICSAILFRFFREK
ncbi:MAG TPA: sugar ABC transporter permease [Tepidisphaeraceae bacterium]|nr:sugar ABC transporter permease [Tepidisphaeraceae bacterium]